MKKYLILLFITLVLLTGCGKKNKVEEKHEEKFILEKIDNDKDYVYLEDFKSIKYDKNKTYDMKNIVINIKGEAIDNINMELKNFVLNSYDNMDIKDDIMIYGNIIDYKYYVTDKYISIIQDYYFYMKDIEKEIDSNVYVIDLNTGKLLKEKDILLQFEYGEEKLFNYVEEHIDSNDVMFTLMQMKNNGYKLYINEDNKMVLIYKELFNDGTIKKELIID